MNLLSRLADLSAGQLSDGMGAVGLPTAGLAGISAAWDAPRMVGRARTVTFRPLVEADSVRPEYLGRVRQDEVLVLDNQGRLDCSVWGGQRSLGAIQRGAVGTVVDGAYRDVDEHVKLRYPVFGRAATIVGSRAAVIAAAADEILSIGEVRVAPGDYVVGDTSGVIVVPQDRALEVIAASEDVREDERRIELAVARGVDFLSLRGNITSL
jgi:regulator of RNase E activity RraA